MRLLVSISPTAGRTNWHRHSGPQWLFIVEGRVRVQKGDTIVVTAMEHHSNLVPWQLLAEARDATGLAIVTEIMASEHIKMVARYADAKTRNEKGEPRYDAEKVNAIATSTAAPHRREPAPSYVRLRRAEPSGCILIQSS
jgi:leucyl aminopeptidase (aminopeptidase T)